MTLPVERARSLRWGWEFLWELRAATNLTAEQQEKVEAILRHYPSSSEIREWAAEMQQGKAVDFPWLEVGDDRDAASTPQSGVPQEAIRGPTTPAQRLEALVAAGQFFQQDLRMCGNLTAKQNRTLLFVCRHYPKGTEMASLSDGTWHFKESNL